MPTGALIAGGLGALGSIGSSLIGSSAAKDASAAQTAMGQQALGVQQSLGQQGIDTLMKMFGIAQGTISPVIKAGFDLANGRGNSLIDAGIGAGGDFRSLGQGIVDRGTGIIDPAAKTLNALLTPGANMTATLSQLPGFQFAQDWGQKAVQNIGSTTGLGGNVLKAGADYATGVAQQGYSGIVQQLQALLGGGTNVLNSGTGLINSGNSLTSILSGIGGNLVNTGYGVAGNGANALTGAAVNAGNSAFGNLNQLGQTIGATTQGIGQSQAAGILGSANAISGGLTGATGAGANALFLSKLLGGGGGGAGGGAGIYSSGGVPSSNLLTGGIGSA